MVERVCFLLGRFDFVLVLGAEASGAFVVNENL